MHYFIINKILNHNIIMGRRSGNEYILIGKGIGFKRRPGDSILESEVATYYLIQDDTKMSDYEKIVLQTPDSVLLITEQAIRYAEEKLNHRFDQSIHISLLDHINFAIYRLNNKINVGSFLSEEYYLMYSELYDVAHEMVNIINDGIEMELPHSEVGSIILHLHAALRNEKLSKTALYAEVISYALSYIQAALPNGIVENSIARARLITHLKFALKRTESELSVDNPLADVIRKQYPEVYLIAKGLSKSIYDTFGIKLSESEVGYIALHVYNLQY